jgi:hypothetical protein
MADRESTATVRVRAQLDAVVVRPGDTLVVRVSGPLAMDTADEMKAGLEELLPGVTPVIVCAEQILVYRPDGGGIGG